jgi:hypothetical protein
MGPVTEAGRKAYFAVFAGDYALSVFGSSPRSTATDCVAARNSLNGAQCGGDVDEIVVFGIR